MKIGDYYILHGVLHILAAVDSPRKVCLINLINGNRFRNPIQVNNIYHIDPEEAQAIGINHCQPAQVTLSENKPNKPLPSLVFE